MAICVMRRSFSSRPPRQGSCFLGLRNILGRATDGGAMDFPQFELHGQIGLVTGAARGLGRAISLALAHAGADVAIGLRDIAADSGIAQEITNLGRRVLPLQMDMSQIGQIFSAVDEAEQKFGRIDILVNNAGIAPENLAENVTEKDFDETLAINLKGTFFASQAVGRVMMRQKSGKI